MAAHGLQLGKTTYPLHEGIIWHYELTRHSWVYPTEVFPLASRSKGAALATFAFSIAGGTINMIIPYLIDAIGF